MIHSQSDKMASQSTGIQQLLTAEKRAAEKVAEARKRKARRLKQAKEEAQAEIEAYRQERERAFREFEAKSMGTKGDMEAKIAENTTRKIQDIHVSVNRQKEPALNKLLQLVYDIKPELHQNMSV